MGTVIAISEAKEHIDVLIERTLHLPKGIMLMKPAPLCSAHYAVAAHGESSEVGRPVCLTQISQLKATGIRVRHAWSGWLILAAICEFSSGVTSESGVGHSLRYPQVDFERDDHPRAPCRPHPISLHSAY